MSLQCPSTSFNTLFSFLSKAIEALVYKLCKKKKKKKKETYFCTFRLNADCLKYLLYASVQLIGDVL